LAPLLATYSGRGPEEARRPGAAAAGAVGRLAPLGAAGAEWEVNMDLGTVMATISVVLQIVALLRKQR
jgi:hypothetical protein